MRQRSSSRDVKDTSELRGRLGLEDARVPQQDRHGLLWLGRGQLYVDRGTLRFKCAGFGDLEPGDYAVPYQLITCLILQPGTSLTHDVLRLCASHGTGIVAVGEGGTRFFASAPFGPNHSARARRQALLWANTETRIQIARRLYAWRLGEFFPNSEIAVLRGMEGSRMKETYRRLAERHGIVWHGRRYDRANPEETDLANQAINHVVTAVEATAMVAVAVTGAIPSLGFIHEDASRAFTLDVTDLFRDTITLPVAFAAAKHVESHPRDDIERVSRRMAARQLQDTKTVLKMIDKIKELLDDERGDSPPATSLE